MGLFGSTRSKKTKATELELFPEAQEAIDLTKLLPELVAGGYMSPETVRTIQEAGKLQRVDLATAGRTFQDLQDRGFVPAGGSGTAIQRLMEQSVAERLGQTNALKQQDYNTAFNAGLQLARMPFAGAFEKTREKTSTSIFDDLMSLQKSFQEGGMQGGLIGALIRLGKGVLGKLSPGQPSQTAPQAGATRQQTAEQIYESQRQGTPQPNVPQGPQTTGWF